MRAIEQIIHDNGGDNTPLLDTHNLTGRAFPAGVEPEWEPYESWDEDEDTYESWLGHLDCE